VQQLDSGVQPAASGIGSNPPDPYAYPGVAGTPAPPAFGAPPDPLQDYEAWSRQIMAHAAPSAARATDAGPAVGAAPSGAPAKPAPAVLPGNAAAPAAKRGAGAPVAGADPDSIMKLMRGDDASPDWRLRAVDADGDGRADAWLAYDGDVLRRQAMDRNGDGRPDRLDVYAGGKVVERFYDDDGDGRFERRETVEEGRVTARMQDRNGDGAYETLTLPVRPDAPPAPAAMFP
jgi:hypothetical protein